MNESEKSDQRVAEEDDRNLPVNRTAQTSRIKRRSKQKALRHGIFASIVLQGEPFRAHVEAEVLVEILACELLRLSRFYWADAQAAPQMFTQLQQALVTENSQVIVEIVDKDREVALVRKQFSPESLIRYGTTISKEIHRIFDQLERLQNSGQSMAE
jgi:hypothetical protein